MTADKTPEVVPRGIRNNNPGNIMYNPSVEWMGEVEPDDKGYARFADAFYGLRALAILLLHYYYNEHLVTIRGIIGRYAPNQFNPTSNYIKFVTNRMGTDGDAKLSFPTDLTPLMEAIVTFENGVCPYTLTQFNRAVTSAQRRFKNEVDRNTNE